MIKFLIKCFIKQPDDTENPIVREKYCVLAGSLGIICNMILFAVKLAVGSVMGSIAIMSDAFNNLSDTGSSVVSVIGARLSNKKPDREHPFGHGRLEYVSSLIVSFIIMLVGCELLKTSAEKIFSPADVAFSPVLVVVLVLSIPVKAWMYSYNRYMGMRIASGVLLAAARDSLNDVAATSAVVFTALLGKYMGVGAIDGAVGAVVSVMIIYSGFQISRDTIGLLLGTPPDRTTICGIEKIIMSEKEIHGMHDLIVHDYGPGRKLASVHAEVSDDCNIVEVHEVIDALERKIEQEMGIHMVIHMDPVSVNCGRTAELREAVMALVREIDSRMNIHDFRMTDGKRNINLIFDLEVPADCGGAEDVRHELEKKIKALDERYNAVINIDTIYI